MTHSQVKHSLHCKALNSSVPLQANDWLDPDMDERFGPFSDCAKSHVAVKPKKGTPQLFGVQKHVIKYKHVAYIVQYLI